MDCTYHTDDLAEAHVLAGLLSSEAIAATVFEAEFGNLHAGRDGFRVVAQSDQLDAARHLVEKWKAGAYALDADADVAPSRHS